MADKVWSFHIHQEYTRSLRHIVSDSDRYGLGVAIRERFEKADDPTKDARPVPNRPGRFSIELTGYVITFEVAVDSEGRLLESTRTIKLLPINVADMTE